MKTSFSKVLMVAVGSGWLGESLGAQSMELADGSGRMVLVQSVRDLLGGRGAPGPTLRIPAAETPRFPPAAEPEPNRVAGLVGMLRTVMLPIQTGKAQVVRRGTEEVLVLVAEPQVQRLGEDHVVLMGTKEQVAAGEAFLQHARANKGRMFQLEVRVAEVPEEAYREHFAARFNAAAETGSSVTGVASGALVLTAEGLQELLAKVDSSKDANLLLAPKLVAQNLQFAEMKSGEHISYIRDFTVRQVQGAWIAEPVVDVLEVGTKIEAMCAAATDGSVIVDLAFSDQTVEKPLAEFKTKVAATGSELTVQMPRVTGCRANMKVMVTSGSTVVVPAQRSNGNWLLVMATVQQVEAKQKSAPR